jgi:hypothetical protein
MEVDTAGKVRLCAMEVDAAGKVRLCAMEVDAAAGKVRRCGVFDLQTSVVQLRYFYEDLVFEFKSHKFYSCLPQFII